MKTAAIFAVAGLAAAAVADHGVYMSVANPTLNPGESTTVTLSAQYGTSSTDYAVAGVATNFVSSGGSDGWSDIALVAPMNGPGTSAGVASATGVDGVIAGQLNFPPAGIFADPTNPIAFWQATYTAPAVVADAFTLDLSTRTTRFDVYVGRDSSLSESRLADLTEGSGAINVVPAPASLALLGLGGLGGLAAARRRR
jgi:hypothetical protein